MNVLTETDEDKKNRKQKIRKTFGTAQTKKYHDLEENEQTAEGLIYDGTHVMKSVENTT